MYEKQIDLKDLFFKILYRWRVLLIAMILGGVIFGVYGYVSIQNEREAKIGDTGKNYLAELTEEQVENIEYFLEYEKQYLLAKENFENSIIQKIDELNMYVLNNVYTVVCDNLERAYVLEEAYEQCLESNEFYERVAEKCSEISSIEVSKLLNIEKNNTKVDTGKAAFTVTFMFDDERICSDVGNVLEDYINELTDRFQDIYGDGSIELVLSKVSKSNSNGIVNIKLAEFSDFETVKNKYSQLKGIVTTEQIDIYKNNKVNNSKTVYVKKIVMGSMLFLIISVMVIAIKYLMDNSIKTEQEVADVYKIPVLGVVNKDKKKKKIFGLIDNIIIKIENGKKKILDKEESKKIISTQISLICQKNALSDVGIVRCDINNESKEICDEIASKIEMNKIKPILIDDIMYNAKEMLKLKEIGGVMLMVTLNETRADEFEKCLEILKRQNIKIIGYIAVR